MISDVKFSLTQNEVNRFTLELSFESEGKKVSEVAFEIFNSKAHVGAFKQYLLALDAHDSPIACDIQPINGQVKRQSRRFFKDLIRECDLTSLRQQLEYLKRAHNKDLANFVKLIVLDLKDLNGLYESLQDIEDAEKSFAEALKGERSLTQVRFGQFFDLIRDNKVFFVMLEGKLKGNLLRLFCKDQREFLEKNETGLARLCQVSEILMNFFKRSFSFRSIGENPCEFEAKDYFLSFRREKVSKSVRTTDLQNLPLLTLYPEYYANSYGEENVYYQTIKKIFEANINYDEETATTEITISRARFC